MRAGRLIHTVVIKRFAAGAVNAFGTAGGAWEHLALLRAELVEAQGLEAITAAGAGDDLATVFRVRKGVAITTADRVLFRALPYRIARVVEIGRTGLELHCESIEAGEHEGG